MDEVQGNSFGDVLKRNLAAITAILSFLALAISVVQSFSAHARLTALILLVTGTFLLVLYNVWIIITTHSSSLKPSIKLAKFGKRFRTTVHIVSALVLVFSWTAAAITTSHKYFGHILFSLGHYELASQHLKAHLQSSKYDYHAAYELAKSYKQLGKTKEYVEALEALSQDTAILSKLEASDRLRKEADLHFQIALTLIEHDYIEGIPNPLQRAGIHIQKARLLTNNPILLFMLGFIRASEAHDQRADPSTQGAYIKSIFEAAKKGIEEAHLSEETYNHYMIQYHYWFGRSLVQIGSYNEAKEELETGLALVKKDMPGNSMLRETFLYRLGCNEFFMSRKPEPAYYYWKEISDKNYLAQALTITGLGLWHKGWNAENEGHKQIAKESFDAAQLAFSEATKLGHKSFLLSFQLGILYFNQKDYINAAVNFEEAVKIGSANPIAFYWLGRAKFHIKGTLGEARQAMDHAAKLNPNDSNTHYWLGRIIADFGDNSSAISEFEKCIEIDKSNTKAYVHLIRAILIRAIDKQENSKEQISQYEKALRYAADGIESAESGHDDVYIRTIQELQKLIWNSLAYSYAERGENLTLAMNYIEEALKSAVDSPYFLDTKAWILIRRAEVSKELTPSQKQQNHDAAETLLNQALNFLPADEKDAKAKTLFHLGYLEKLRGADGKAREFFVRALKFNPQYERAKEALE